MGTVVDPRLRVIGIANLRVADASVMPNVVSGNTNAASIMIGEKAAEMLAADHGVQLDDFVINPVEPDPRFRRLRLHGGAGSRCH